LCGRFAKNATNKCSNQCSNKCTEHLTEHLTKHLTKYLLVWLLDNLNNQFEPIVSHTIDGLGL
jgi:hypothetical protein